MVDEEPTYDDLNSDEGFDVEAAVPIVRDFVDCTYIWEPVDKRTNNLVRDSSNLDQLFAALMEFGWRLAKNDIVMFGVLQKTRARRRPKRRPTLQEYDFVSH